MKSSKLKILFCIAVGLIVLVAPFSPDILPGGKTYALGLFGDGGSGGGGDGSGSGSGSGGSGPIAAAPEPTTLLLVGAGAAGIVALRKKFKK